MRNRDEIEYQNKAKQRAEYLAAAKERMETASIGELLLLFKKSRGEISFLAGEEIERRAAEVMKLKFGG